MSGGLPAPGPGPRRALVPLSIPSDLHFEQLRVAPALLPKPGVCAAFQHAPVLDHDDLIRHAHGREAEHGLQHEQQQNAIGELMCFL